MSFVSKRTHSLPMKMNTSYGELDTDIEADIPNEREKKTSSCMKDIGWYLKWITFWVLFMLTIFIVVSYFIELIECRKDGPCHYDIQHDHYLKENYNKTKHRRLTVAGVIAANRRRRHKHTCEDYEFGCCHIYTECKYNETAFTDYHTYTFHGLPKHDKEGTNCPRLLELVTGHNYHYPLPDYHNCENSENGCYKVETECDVRIRYMDVEDGLDDDIYLYKKNVNGGLKYTNLVERVGIDRKPSITELMYEYLYKYPSKDFDSAGVLFGFAMLALIAMCSNACHN